MHGRTGDADPDTGDVTADRGAADADTGGPDGSDADTGDGTADPDAADAAVSTVWWPGLVPVAVVLAVAVAAGAAGLPADRVLVVEDADTGERLLSVPVENGTNVTVAYTHSVERTPVLDVYAVDGDRLVATRMLFRSYGWGLPSRADVETVDGWFVTRPDWSGEDLYVKPGRIADHRLVVDGRAHDLVALSGAETVRIHLVRRSSLGSGLASADASPTGALTQDV